MRPHDLFFMPGTASARGVEGAGKVDGEDRVPFLDGKFLDRGDVLDAGIVDQDIDAAERILGFGHHAVDFGVVGHVGARYRRTLTS